MCNLAVVGADADATGPARSNAGNDCRSIQATVQLDIDDQTRHSTYLLPAPYEGFNHRVGAKTMKKITVRNARNQSEFDLTLDEAAFELVECPTELSTEDFYAIQEGNEKLKEDYYKEVSDFVKQKLGCDKVVCIHSQVRNESKSDGKVVGSGVSRYATVPHTDNSPVSSDVSALRILEEHKDTTKYRRYAYINLWRNISEEPIQNFPLAVMDERSAVKPDDYIPKDFIYDHSSIVQWSLSARHYDVHRWYYFHRMTKSEGILFKQTDSDFTKTGRSCFHMAVPVPGAPVDAPPRESIELRMYCYWKKHADTADELDTMPTNRSIHRHCIRDPRESLLDQPLGKASSGQLLKALLGRIPLLGERILAPAFAALCAFVGMLVRRHPPKTMPNLPYSGNPEDYFDRFLREMQALPSQPQFVIDDVRTRIDGCGEIEGIQLVTQNLVDDRNQKNGTAALRAIEKQEVVAYLLHNEQYMAVSRKHLDLVLL
ncbi:unnamed protein product [Pseudo-nitzschia multistriata]|uniref:Uncharacterized protein n=1 Tax=Pseudo-nitzschia multistriata TaxID=183589 RepID=A0A448ZC74_9STRA|nr:unnamed protein product [Pseudo-nitzschia multistriata]